MQNAIPLLGVFMLKGNQYVFKNIAYQFFHDSITL